MSAGLFKDILERMNPWFYDAAGFVILAAMITFFGFSFWGVKRFSTAISNVLKRDDRIKELQDKLDEEKGKHFKSEMVSSQITTALFNIRPFIQTLNSIRTEMNPGLRMQEALNLIQRILDQLSSDIKVKSGERHRCGIWIHDERILKLSFVSSGFPRHYKNFRMLDIDHSTAGKSFRKKQTLRVPDVATDSDWEPNQDSKNSYTSLICVPLGAWGVLTIDGLKELSEECELIGELYATIIEGAVQEHDHGFYLKNYSESLENDEEVG